jgi:hypothetical protein
MKKLLYFTPPAVYEHVTGHVVEQVASFMTDAGRHVGAESRARHERAYGLYLGWRAIAAEMTTLERFREDDYLIEHLISDSPHSKAQFLIHSR